ncbi:MAG: hypothetical protein WC539_03200 [Nitrospirota bacterium]
MIAPTGSSYVSPYIFSFKDKGIAGVSAPEAIPALDHGPHECKICQERKYHDVSSDASVSFQTPTSVPPELAASAVRFHEQEHVMHNAVTAEQNGLKAASTVQIHTAVCPECGKLYVSGGTTITQYSAKQYPVAPSQDSGSFVNIWA